MVGTIEFFKRVSRVKWELKNYSIFFVLIGYPLINVFVAFFAPELLEASLFVCFGVLLLLFYLQAAAIKIMRGEVL